MDGIVPEMRWSATERLVKRLRKIRAVKLRTRYLIVVNLVRHRTASETARALSGGRSTVYHVSQRFRGTGEAGLVDRREENGTRKLDERYLATLYETVRSSPENHGWLRPTWTREMLVKTLRQKTGTRIHVARMSVALKLTGARRGRPKPTVNCPWSAHAKQRKLREIRQLAETLPANEVLIHEDEVDIHLNPKIGLDWMVRGQQKQVLTPGTNEKRYLAGAQDVRTGELIWVEGEQKNSLLFLRLLWELTRFYPQAKVIHVVLDHYSIHHTQQVEVSLDEVGLDTEQGRRLRRHFLPPYCPDHNRIERTGEDLHANVTRNHTCQTMKELMRRVRSDLSRRNHKTRPAISPRQTRSACRVHESRTDI